MEYFEIVEVKFLTSLRNFNKNYNLNILKS